MAKNLIIVESPAKAKTIEGYLGKDFIVKSSYGHVRDLPKEGLNIDIKNGFKPHYEINEDKKEILNELRKYVNESDIIWLATDDDREGEAISWHLFETLNLKHENTKRIVFREITKNAILNAIENPREIDLDLVNAQQARRILDRLVGYELSPILWKKIKTGLSAGRVQSVAVRLIVEREREIEQFKSKYTYKISAVFETKNGKCFTAKLNTDLDDEQKVQEFLEKCKNSEFFIKSIEKKEGKKTPSPPFTTSTLQQEAGRKLGFSVAQTMIIAQKLYESGKISYMRTDSVNLSEQAIEQAQHEITKTFGKNYSLPRKYTNKIETAQEAHEAIRPTDFSVHTIVGDRNEQRLYELIWKRAIASQMSDALVEKTHVIIEISNLNEYYFQLTGETIKFDGFLKVYLESSEEDTEDEDTQASHLPNLTINEKLIRSQIKATQTFSRPPARYTEPGLVKKLEELGIGRPSTYAPTISTIQKRAYVIKENREGKERKVIEYLLENDFIKKTEKTEIYGAEKAKLFPTDLAMIVNDFLVKYFPKIIDYGFTAKIEEEFDQIAEGKLKWDKMIENFYQSFHKTVEKTETIDRSEVTTSRELGIHPETGKKVYAKLGKFGPYVQIGENDDEPKPLFASLKKGQLIETITLEEALELFKLPRQIGFYENLPLIASIGKFGPYIKHNDKFYSLNKGQNPLTITEEEAIELIETKRKIDAQKIIKTFDENENIKVLNGRYGPYIAFGDKNIKIPKDKKADELTLEECLKLIEEHEKNSTSKKRKTKKTK